MKINKFIILLIILSFTYSSNIDELRGQYINGELVLAYNSTLEFISNNSEDPMGFVLASEIALSLDSLGKANEYLLKAIDLDKANESFRKQWASLDSLRQKLKEANRKNDSGLINDAIIAFEDIIDSNPKFAMPYHRLGRIYYSENDFNEAVYYFRKAIDINPFNISYQNDITNIAKKLLQEGDKIFKRKNYESAVEKYIQSTKIDPTYAVAFYKVGKAYYKIGDFDLSKVNLEQAIEIDEIHVQSLKLLGDIESKDGNDEKAVYWYEKAVKANSNYHIAHYALGKSYYRLQKNEPALMALNSAVMVDPTYAKAYELIGIIYQSNGKLDESISSFQLAVANNSKAYIANFRLASVLNELKNYSEAKLAAKACIDIKRKYAGAWYELGIAEKNLGNKAAAKIAFKEATKDRKWKKSAQYEIKMLDKES
jgi:tetratricopeptide (TPR) repeat protein